MILNGTNILPFLTTKNLGKTTQVGYDLTAKNMKRVMGGIIKKDQTRMIPYRELDLLEVDDFFWVLQPGVYSVTFDQGCKIPNDKVAFIWPRSSLLRCGVDLKTGVYDPGFEVEEMGAILFVHEKVTIEKGSRLGQIFFFDCEPVEDGYDGQWQGKLDIK